VFIYIYVYKIQTKNGVIHTNSMAVMGSEEESIEIASGKDQQQSQFPENVRNVHIHIYIYICIYIFIYMYIYICI
jgi:hypothetical protein